MRNLRRPLLVLVAAAAVALPVSASVSAQAAPVKGASSTNQSLATATTYSRSCGTGGYWYMTDSLFVTRTNVGGTRPWKFVITYSKNRSVYTGSTYVQHTATKLTRFSNGNELRYTPSQGFTVYTTSPYEDYQMAWDVYPSGSTIQKKYCTVNW